LRLPYGKRTGVTAVDRLNIVAHDRFQEIDVAVEWCRRATDHAASYDGKPWTYVLVPHDAIAENMTVEGLARQFAVEGAFVS
jgi:hypothetical protein